MKQLYLVDNSVTARVERFPAVRAALVALLGVGELATCLPTYLEECFSARNHDQFRQLRMFNQQSKVFLEPSAPVAEMALLIQQKLSERGMLRAVGVSDLQIAATAIHHTRAAASLEGGAQRVTVVHYDSDFERVAEVMPQFHHQWIVSRGSVD